MLYILIFLFVTFVILIFISKKYQNPYKLYMIFGKKGSGKSTYLTKLSNYYNSKHYKVFCNTEIFGTYYFNTEDLGKFTFPQNSVILIDEIGTIFHCRDFKSFPKEVRDFFKYQRQYKLIVYMTSQSFDVDKSLRNLCDEIYLSVSLLDIINIMKPIQKNITLSKQEEEDKPNFLTEDYKFKPFFTWKLTFIPHYKYYFKSYNPPKLPFINNTYYYQFTNISQLIKIRNTSGYIKYLFIEFKHKIKYLIQKINKVYYVGDRTTTKHRHNN